MAEDGMCYWWIYFSEGDLGHWCQWQLWGREQLRELQCLWKNHINWVFSDHCLEKKRNGQGDHSGLSPPPISHSNESMIS